MTSVATTTPLKGGGAAGEVRPSAHDRASLGDLYDRYGSTAYSLALSITNDPAAAERIVTAAFATTWRECAPDVSNARTINFFGALVTRVRAHAVGERSARPFAVAFDRPNGGRSGSSLAVANALCDLPDAQRQVLALAYFGGFAVSEIATTLRQPVSNVKVNLHAALDRLRAILASQPRGAAQ